MIIELKNKKTLVIGGARGIGAEIVRSCAASGSDVAWSFRGEAGMQATKELLEEVTFSLWSM